MKKLFKALHKWLAVPAGLIITITCLTGAMLVFQDEILEFSNPSHYTVDDVKAEIIPLDRLIPMVNQQLDSNRVASVKIPSDTSKTYTMTLTEGFRISAFVDPYTGEIKGYYNFGESGFFTVMKIHRWLLDGSRSVGKYTVGICTLLFAVILISGMVLWFPREFRKSRFKIQIRKGKKRFFYDLHNVLGAYACLILLICSLTGMMWSFEWYRNSVFKLFGAKIEQPENAGRHGKGKQEKPEVNIAVWQKVADNLRTANPENEFIRIDDGKAAVRLKGMATSRAVDEYKFDKMNGEITETTLYEAQPVITKIWGWTYALHVGNYWGIWSKILTFIASLIGASLPLTGYYIMFVKSRKRKKNKKRHS